MICCFLCEKYLKIAEKATKVAPRYIGGDEDGLIEWIPVCAYHFQHWCQDMAGENILPDFDLTEEHHSAHPDHSLVSLTP